MPRPPASNNRSWMTTKEVADTFDVTTATVRDWIDAKKIAATQHNTYFRIEKSEVQRFARLRYAADDQVQAPPE